MKPTRTLSRKLGLVGASLLTVVLLSIAMTLSVTWKLEGGAAAVNEAGRLRMQAWRMAQELPAASPQEVAGRIAEFDASLDLLRRGDPARPLMLPRDARTRSELESVQLHRDALQALWLARPAPSARETRLQTEDFVARVDGLVMAIERQLFRDTAVLHAFQLTLMVLAIGSAVALVYTAYVFVLNPLARLQEALGRVAAGDLRARVPEAGQDEFSALGKGFNRMAQTLEGLYQGLEARVQEKTRNLEGERARLSALYEAAAFVTRAGTLDELARGFATQIRKLARADASVVRWSDENNQRYVLLAHDGMPQELADSEHCMPAGGCHCGQTGREAQTRVIPIAVLEAQTTRPSDPLKCSLYGFVGVISVPVRVHERVVGEIDLFYRQTPELGGDDRALLEALASHLAAAIEGLRADALEREAAVAEERTLLARELHDSIAQSLAFMKIQATLLRQAHARGDADGIGRVLSELDAGIQESLADVRELLLHFRTRTNSEDFATALRVTLKKFEHQTGLSTRLTQHGEGLALPSDTQIQVLHVVQEALSNVRKHARATQVWVDVEHRAPWRVRVRDDGRGFAPHGHDLDETHVGMFIMRERAASIGAQVVVRALPDGGTEVELTLPAPASAVPVKARQAAPAVSSQRSALSS
jgi:two-component system, NarL family, nitrate/nitrite sensor histidine kinase NarX